MHQLILRAWQKKNTLYYLFLIPLSWLFAAIASLRRFSYQVGLLPSYQLAVPVIIVGNINMGGSGKTPVVMWLVEELKKAGYSPGVISRGYGGDNKQLIKVQQNSLATDVGDEPLLIARRVGCPVWVGVDRVAVGKALLNAHPECNVIVSDDGLQHYRLQRNVELVVADEQTTLGQRLLPAGPLRESYKRLETVDAVICNGKKTIPGAFGMRFESQVFYNLANPSKQVAPAYFKGKAVSALAGIGKPTRFFNYLKTLGVAVKGLSFDDHYAFSAKDLDSISCDAIIMTEKDAVKCESFAQPHHWVLPVNAKMDATLFPLILEKIKVAADERNDTTRGV